MASSSSSLKLYDAFISHRGPDVKDTLAKQLYKLLEDKDCRAFLDREEIEGGESISSAIRKGICSSVVQIAIFSKGYAKSKWCLNELVDMLEQTDALFIPVFYDVDPRELRDIKNEKSAYAAAFLDYQRRGRSPDELHQWEEALKSAADRSGYELSQHKDNLCEKIVSRVLQEMHKRIPLNVAKYPVGLAELVKDFESSCSETASDKVTIVGIFGLGGSGKTTLAKALFNRKRPDYDASCFLSAVRESHANHDLQSLQRQLFKDLFNENRVFRNVDEGIEPLKHRLSGARDRKLFIVLDDIDRRDQLDALLPEGVLSSGSFVLITTRNQNVLTGADISYKMKGMNVDHAKELFCSHAFRRRDPPIAYEKLVESFVKFCGGLPLSLIVLGAHVYRKDEDYWKLELEKVRKVQHKDIKERLKISFDSLESEEQQIFIDIACFLVGGDSIKLKTAISIWNVSDWSAQHAVQILQEKCLIEVRSSPDFQRFEMHDHLRDLGRHMAEVFGPPRLWKPDCLRSMEAEGFEQILAEKKDRCIHSFEDKFLKAKITYLIGNSNDSAETQLLWLEIDNGYGNLKRIPSWIRLQKLHCLTVWRMEELWSSFQQQLQTNTQASFKLRILKISYCPPLQNLPDLIRKFNHLEELHIIRPLEKTDITAFLRSLEQLSNLRVLKVWEGGGSLSGNLNLSKGRDSTNLEASTSSSMDRLETIEFRNLGNISKLLISGAICPRLQSLEVVSMRNVNEMDLKQLQSLSTLIVQRCPKLKKISGLLARRSGPSRERLGCLERIEIADCHQLQNIEGLEELQGLRSLVIHVPEYGDPSVWNSIYGLRSLPSEYTILTGKPGDTAWSRFDANLFSDLIGAQAVAEIERGSSLEMGSSSSAITIYTLIITSYGARLSGFQTLLVSQHIFPNEGEWMVTVLLPAHDSNVRISDFRIHKGFMVKIEERKAKTVLQRIFDRLYA